MNITFKTYEPEEDEYSHQIEAFRGEDFLGYIALDPDSLNVQMIQVEERFRRQGIGTALFGEAKRQHPQLTTRKRTPDGDAFFSALGIKR